MGSNTSKVTNDVGVQAQKNDSEINCDPRSPTPEISRTPLQVNPSLIHHAKFMLG